MVAEPFKGLGAFKCLGTFKGLGTFDYKNERVGPPPGQCQVAGVTTEGSALSRPTVGSSCFGVV